MVFKRKLYDRMLAWKRERKGSSALLIKGARRVGKSTLVEEFAKREYKSYILIDFAQTSREIDELFDNMRDLNYFFFRLQNIFHTTLHERKSAIIFDEVQLNPKARQSIKFLVKDGRYDYIETGSLLSIKKNVQNILIPSEETRITLHPMDFDEFLWAIGDYSGPDLLHQAFLLHRPMGQAAHREWMRNLRKYMVVGGMPQAVDTYIQTNNLQMVDEKKREILMLYDDDFRKIDDSGNISKLLMDIPAQLSGNANRYIASSATQSSLREKESSFIADITDSQVVTIAHHANDPNVGMGLTKDKSRYKLFLADTGLFITLAFWDKDYTENTIYSKLLSDKLSANLGYVYENLVAQMLTSAGHKLYYYTFPDGNKHNYEIDFLLTKKDKIIPLEIKSSGYNTHKSLDLFCQKFSSRIGQRYLIYPKDLQQDGQTICFPIYYTDKL